MSSVKLGDVTMECRDTYKGDKAGMAIVGLEHITPEEVTLSNWSEDSENTFTRKFSKGDVLFGRRRAYLKKAAVAPFDGICSGDITVIRAKEDKLCPDLLPFIIQNDALFDYAVGKSAGSLSPRVKWEHLKNYQFNLPQMENQEKLAETLWAINDTILAYRSLIENTNRVVRAYFIDAFGDTFSSTDKYETVPLSQIFVKPQAGEWGKEDVDGIGVPVLRTTNFTDEGNVKYDDVVTRIIDEKKVKKKSLSKGDILIEKSGGSNDKPVGRVVLFEGEDNKYLNNNFTACLHLNGKYEVSNLYVFYFMFVNYWMGGTKLFEGKTTGIHNLKLMDYLNETRIPLAPIEEQLAFEKIARESKESILEAQTAIKNAKGIRSSIMKMEILCEEGSK